MGYTDDLHSLSHTNGTVSIEIDIFGVGYYVDTVRKNSKASREYIRNQLKEDYITEELELED